MSSSSRLAAMKWRTLISKSSKRRNLSRRVQITRAKFIRHNTFRQLARAQGAHRLASAMQCVARRRANAALCRWMLAVTTEREADAAAAHAAAIKRARAQQCAIAIETTVNCHDLRCIQRMWGVWRASVNADRVQDLEVRALRTPCSTLLLRTACPPTERTRHRLSPHSRTQLPVAPRSRQGVASGLPYAKAQPLLSGARAAGRLEEMESHGTLCGAGH